MQFYEYKREYELNPQQKIYEEIGLHLVGYFSSELVDSLRSHLGDDNLLSKFSTLDKVEVAIYLEEQILTIIEDILANLEESYILESVRGNMGLKKKEWLAKDYFSLKNYISSSNTLYNYVKMIDLLFDIEKITEELYRVNYENYGRKIKYANQHRKTLDYEYLNDNTKTSAEDKALIWASNNSPELNYVAFFEQIMYYSYSNLNELYLDTLKTSKYS